MVHPHLRVQALALVDAQGLLEIVDGLAPLTAALVDEAEIVERHDETVGVADAPERRGGVLQPLDRLVAASETPCDEAHRHAETTDRAVIVGLAQHGVSPQPVATATAIASSRHGGGGQPGGDARQQTAVVECARDAACFVEWRQRGFEMPTRLLRLGETDQQPDTLLRLHRARGKRSAIFVDGPREVVRGKIEVADRLTLRCTFTQRKVRMGGIGGDRSLQVRTLV